MKPTTGMIASHVPSHPGVPPLPPFGGYGLELEYMIVDRSTLDALPLTERLFRDSRGRHIDEIDAGQFEWTKEVFRHVIEIKNPEPVSTLRGLADGFREQILEMNGRLAAMGAQLMPSSMHPWLDSRLGPRIWDEPRDTINRAYASIFDLHTHGWANLQSTHINIAFGSDRDFARLHSAVRVVLPIIPAIAASSPIADGIPTGDEDFRLQVYRTNASGFPTITGDIVPEVVVDCNAYQTQILDPMYRAIARHDPHGLLSFEWLNSRGAIARFDRSAIEIRVTDIQETPQLDVAIAAAVIGVVKLMHGDSVSGHGAQDALGSKQLARLLFDCARGGGSTTISDSAYLRLFRYPGGQCTASQLWHHLSQMDPVVREIDGSDCAASWEFLLSRGTLASRLLRAVGDAPSRATLESTYRRLGECLAEDHPFEALTSP